MHYDVESFDYSALDYGMVDDAMEENTDVVNDYVQFLVKNGLVTLECKLNQILHICVNILMMFMCMVIMLS